MLVTIVVTMLMYQLTMFLILVCKIPDMLATCALMFVHQGLGQWYIGGGAVSTGMRLPNGASPARTVLEDSFSAIGRAPWIIIIMADVLKKSCAHQECFLARLGGDEFVIVGEEKDAFRPASLAETITAQVAEFNRQTREPFQLSISAGWAYFQPGKVNTADALLMAADESMYVVKEGKRTRLPRPRRFHQLG